MKPVITIHDDITKIIERIHEAEKSCLETTWEGKLDAVKRLMDIEKEVLEIKNAIPLTMLTLTGQTKIGDLCEEGLISMKAYQVFQRNRIYTIGDVLDHTEQQLKDLSGLGAYSLQRLLGLLHSNGFRVQNDTYQGAETKEPE